MESVLKAICVTDDRRLEVRDVPMPERIPPGHILVALDSATITHGDKFFLTNPLPGGGMVGGRQDVYGSNGGGTVVAMGADVPARYADKQVAIYKSLIRSAESIGMWSEYVLAPYASSLILPDHVRARDYNGSFANVLTVYAFLAEVLSAGHKGIIVTAGTSATGLIAASMTSKRRVPAIFLVRSQSAQEQLLRNGVEHVFLTSEPDFETRLEPLAARLGTTAVFDGLGGELLSRLLPRLPINSTAYVYGFLGGPQPISLSATLIMGKNLTVRRFANLETATVSSPQALFEAMNEIESLIDDPLFKTRIGREFSFEQVHEAMAFEGRSGVRAVLVP